MRETCRALFVAVVFVRALFQFIGTAARLLAIGASALKDGSAMGLFHLFRATFAKHVGAITALSGLVVTDVATSVTTFSTYF